MGNIFIEAFRKPEAQTFDDDFSRRLIELTQAGLPVSATPYADIAEQLGVSSTEVIERLRQMLAAGAIRRIGAVPNHYALGYRGNGMSVWDVPDELIDEVGREMAALDYVSHCYQRPRFGAQWPYNLFAMVHGHDRDEVMDKVAEMSSRFDGRIRRHEVLFSTRILKKTGLRIGRGKQKPPLAKGGLEG